MSVYPTPTCVTVNLQQPLPSSEGGTPTMATIAALRAATSTTAPGTVCRLLGYTANNDGGQGAFVVGANATDNGGTIINDASGRSWYRDFPAGTYNVRWFGATGNGSTDDTAAINSALAAMPSGGILRFPPGSYVISSTINVTASFLTLEGGGSANTTIAANFGNNDILHLTGTWVTIKGFLFNGTPASWTTGYCINSFGSDQWIEDVVINNGYFGIGFNGTSSQQTVFVDRCILNNLISSGITFGTTFGGVASVSNIAMQCTGNTNVGVGINIQSGDTFMLSNCNVAAFTIGLQITPPASTFVRNVHAVNCLFDGAPRTSSTQPAGIINGSATSADVSRVRLTNCWFASYPSTEGLFIDVANDVCVVNCSIINNGTNGVHITGACNGIHIDGCTVGGNGTTSSGTYDGIHVDNNVSNFSLTGNMCYPVGSFVSNTQKYGINIVGTTNDYYIITGNRVTGNVTSGLNNAGTGTHTVVANNL